MSKITVIPDDNLVGIDKDFHSFAYVIDSNIHAIHWDDIALTGKIEYKNKVGESIDTFSDYQYLLIERTASIAVELQSKTEVEAARTPMERRRGEYPSVSVQLEALYQARQGDNTKLIVIDDLITTIDLKYPL